MMGRLATWRSPKILIVVTTKPNQQLKQGMSLHASRISFAPSPTPQEAPEKTKAERSTVQKLEELADANVGLELNDDGDVWDVDTLEIVSRSTPVAVDQNAKEQISKESRESKDESNEEKEVQFAKPQRKLNLGVTRTAIPTLQQRKKFVLSPGHGPLDWERLKRSGLDMRCGLGVPAKIPRQEVAKHATKDDCWMILQGKVYNLTPYMDFHPGGVDELLRAAGKDGTVLFQKTHAWVNTEYLLDACFLGFVV